MLRMRWGRGRKPVRTRIDEATRSPLMWLAGAAALWASQARRPRRAGLRGAVSAAIAWGAATALTRITGTDVRGPATAAAFTTGAALEAPTSALPAGVAAALVLRRADPRDVAAAVTGAGLALASIRVWPVPPDEGASAPKIEPRDAHATEEGDGVYVAVNVDAGTESPTEELKDAFPQAKVEEIEIVEGDELRKALDSAAEHAFVLGVSGGDGSINTAAQVALDHDKPLAVFPSGTLNHLTGGIGMSSIDDAVDAVRAGEAIEIDVATIDDHVFVNTASFGAYVELVDMREKLEKRLGKWPAVLVAVLRVLRRAEPVEIEIDGRAMKVWMAFIGNCKYSPSGFAPSWREHLDDGRIDFRFIDGSQPWARLRLVAAILTGRLGRSKVYRQSLVDELRITSREGPLRLARDGETFEASSDEIVIRKLPRRLTIYCPHDGIA